LLLALWSSSLHATAAPYLTMALSRSSYVLSDQHSLLIPDLASVFLVSFTAFWASLPPFVSVLLSYRRWLPYAIAGARRSVHLQNIVSSPSSFPTSSTPWRPRYLVPALPLLQRLISLSTTSSVSRWASSLPRCWSASKQISLWIQQDPLHGWTSLFH
jgi:hypothetical protein